MQYILTQEEYDSLRRDKDTRLADKKAELQKLCTDAANHIPVTQRQWSTGGRMTAPWGCILDENSPNYDGYCDDCPAQQICPHDGKDYSQ